MIIHNPVITGSFQINGNNISSVESIDNVSSSVVVLNDASASFSDRVSLAERSVDSLNSASSSYLLNTTDTLDGDLTVTGKITAQEFHTEFVSASIIFKSGSTRFGDTYDDTHVFTGSLENIYSENGVTGSFRARGGSITVEGLDSDINLRLTSGSGASLGEIRFWVDDTQIGEINMDKRDGEMTIQTQTSDGGILFRPNNTSLLFLTGSSVGIGTTVPTAVLSLIGGSGLSDLSVTSNPFTIGATDSINLAFDTNEIQARNNGSAENLLLQKNGGRLGIGFDNPNSTVHVEDKTTDPTIITLDKSGNNSKGIKFNRNVATDASIIVNDQEDLLIGYNEDGLGDNLIIHSNGSTVMQIKSNGYVGIGTSVANDRLHVYDATSNVVANFESGDADCWISFKDSTTSSYARAYLGVSGENMLFHTTSEERMRITSGGDVLVATTSNPTQNSARMVINDIGSSTSNGLVIGGYANNEMLVLHSRFDQPSGGVVFKRGVVGTTNVVGSIRFTSTATSFNTTSDYRVKENIVPIQGALDRVHALKPSRFNFIAEPENKVDGFIAHEVAEIVPEAVNGKKDAIDKDGNPIYQGIDQSKLVPLLTAAIQELKAEVDQLKAQLNS